MIQVQLKLRPCKGQVAEMERWLIHLGSIYNFAIRKIELNAANNIYFSGFDFRNILAGHSRKLDVPSHVIQDCMTVAHTAWSRCFKGIAGRPRLKGCRNPLRSIGFSDPIARPKGSRIKLLGLGSIRFHKMEIPEGRIKAGRIVRRASGWCLCLFIDAMPAAIERQGDGVIGIDPGFKSLLALSTGEIVEHPRELEGSAKRLACSQRGKHRARTARIQERIGNQRKDRNHKLSRRLVAENRLIAFSADRHNAIARRFGKSVTSSSHGELRRMLSYKSASSGTTYIEVNPKYSTMTCSACGCLSGPTGLAGLAVRHWTCIECGTHHERDVNAARNTLTVAVGSIAGVQEPLLGGDQSW